MASKEAILENSKIRMYLVSSKGNKNPESIVLSQRTLKRNSNKHSVCTVSLRECGELALPRSWVAPLPCKQI